MHWGVRRDKKVFVSGSWRIRDQSSGYYRDKLPKDISDELDQHIKNGSRILVGDAPGTDSMVQDYLADKKYKKVDIYATGGVPRKNSDDGTLGWKIHNIDGKQFEPGSKEWLRLKDEAMTRDSTQGLAVILPDGGAGATRKNVKRLIQQMKDVKVYELKDRYSTSIQDGWKSVNEVLLEPD